MGTEKRERQKEARWLKIEAEQVAATKARRRRTAIRLAVATVVIAGGLLAYSAIWGGDDGSAETSADESSTTTPESTTVPETTTTTFSDPELAAEVLGRDPPAPEPPPADTAADALDVSTLIEGSGTAVAAGDTVVVHYTGLTPDGNVFDSSWDRGEPVPFVIGQGMVIPGWDEGLIGATIGERRRLVIGADKAYGAEGRPDGGIPPNSPLAFEVDIVDVVKPA